MGSDDGFIYGNTLEEHHSRLGWEFYFFRKSDTDARGDSRHSLRYLATWGAGLGGDKWIDDLVASGKAKPLEGVGPFRSYSLTTNVLIGVLRDGIPKHTGPRVIGDDYVTSSGWTGDVKIDWDALHSLEPDEVLLVDVVDQS